MITKHDIELMTDGQREIFYAGIKIGRSQIKKIIADVASEYEDDASIGILADLGARIDKDKK